MTADVTKRTKAEQPWVVGTWNDEEGANVFIPFDKQPEEPLTQLNQMVAWVKQNIGEPGTYSFIRKAPGRLVLAQQTTMKAVLE